ncbi:hypothetical protein J437_LFUL004133 [Ladona fulva]|uniref:receptor protein-tyrosine kinase n=1 Tax=Ladona fulva TaxID=123851 RepID=A0A8K0NY50_LADFU|nr:hypothetical protein J437_LFUL004133 [Ladona fulva]
MVISSGDALYLRCESKEPVSWSIPRLEAVENGVSSVYVNNTVSNGASNPFISYLTVSNTDVTDTGYYYCHHRENKNFSDWITTAYVYVYVNDSDILLAVNQSFLPLSSVQHQDTIIPCKPSSPDVKVSLIKDDEEIDVIESGFTYDPREGFINSSPAIFDSGFYECVAERGDVTQTVSISLIIISHTNDVPRPIINDSNARHVVVGNDFKLECFVKIPVSVIFFLDWEVPNQFANESGRLEFSDSTSAKRHHNQNEYIEGTKSLTIRNASKEDRGTYTCSITDHTDKKKSSSKFIEIYDPDISYINFTVQGNVYEIVARAGDRSVQWVVHVVSHPPATLYWYDPKNKDILKSKKYDLETSPTETKLKINEIGINDAGLYQLRGFNSKMEKILNLSLVVHDIPAVEVAGQMYYMYKTLYRVNCTVVGYPMPNVTWIFQICEEGFEDCHSSQKRMNRTLYRETLLSKGKKVSELEITAIKSGYLTCQACNHVGCSKEAINFIVTDVSNGFETSLSPAHPVVGDEVNLTCGTSRFNYSDSINWYKYVNSDYELITGSSGYHLQSKENQLSRSLDIKIDSVNQTHAGVYQCRVVKSSDEIEEQEVEVIVQEIQPPLFVENSMNGTIYSVEPGAKIEWKCEAVGVPKPQVVWYKDDQLLNIEKENVELWNDNQLLRITFANYEDEGKYMCRAENKGGMMEGFATLTLNDNRAKVNAVLYGLIIVGTCLLILVVFLMSKNLKEKKLRKELEYAGLGNFDNGALENINPELGVDDQAELLPYDKKWEFPRDKLKLGRQLGSGAFGVVMKADAYGIIEGEAVTTVAVKMVKRNAEYTHIRALASELKIMVHLGKHLNVVNLLGACTKNLTKRELLVIVEYCRFGNLQNYLLRHREDFIDEIDPVTGKVVPDRVVNHERQPDSSKTAVKGDSRIKYAALSFSTSASQSSVQDYRAAPMVKQDSSFCNDNASHTVNTDMSLISMSPSGEECVVTGGSGCGAPGWHTNYKGDYARRDVRPICTRDLVCWAFQVARGIDYLASRRVLHGDLAARNILLAEDNVVKICDFGLAKSMYKSDNYKKKGDGPLPVKWMAIESIRDRVFSTQSDVWSYGIVLWEFFSLARTPYPGCLIHIFNFFSYSVMLECWNVNPSERPTFSALSDKLGGMLEDAVKRHYIDLNSPYLEMNTQEEGKTDLLGMMSEPSYANAMREMTPEREYVNVPQSPSQSQPMDYMTMSSPQADDVSESGYLCMRSGSMSNGNNPSVIFSPRPNPSSAFSFEVPPMENSSPKLRAVEREGAEGPELSPMLPIPNNGRGVGLQKEGSLDSGMGSPKSYFNPSYRTLPNANGQMLPNTDSANYINIPSSKARDSNRSSGFQSEAGDMSPMPDKSFSSFEIPPKIAT